MAEVIKQTAHYNSLQKR